MPSFTLMRFVVAYHRIVICRIARNNSVLYVGLDRVTHLASSCSWAHWKMTADLANVKVDVGVLRWKHFEHSMHHVRHDPCDRQAQVQGSAPTADLSKVLVVLNS